MGALTGLRLIETGTLTPARLVGTFFSGLGVDVIRIVPPGIAGNRAEAWAGADSGNVRALALDLYDPRGVGLLRRLVRRSDILVDGHEPGALDALGLGWPALNTDNPGLILVRTAAFRAAPDPADRRQALPADADLSAATAALLAALVMLHRRHRTGEGADVAAPIRVAVSDAGGASAPQSGLHRSLLGLSAEELQELARDGII
jgi:crotonobetainyl-CoA:carnitine CoA-transferase CaiB-like acyl-CoA transferase